MLTVRQLLRDRKPHDLWTIGPATTVNQALKLMAEKNVGALPVIEGSKLVGIFTERDVARTVILRDCLNRPVSDLMTRDVITISPEQDIKECMALITDECVRHLPVLDNGELIGIVSIGDIVKTIIDLQQCTIDSLESYVTGKGYA